MGGTKAWIFRALLAVATGLFLFSWFNPWWEAYIVRLEVNAVEIYAHGLVSFIPDEYLWWISGYDDIMPAFFTPLMWVWMGLCVLALLASMFLSNKKGLSLGKFRMSWPTILIAVVGISMIVVCIIGIIVILANLESFFGAPLNGRIMIDFGDPYASEVDTKLLPSYYILAGTGVFLIVLSFLRRFFVKD
ncbi:MAG: hypothetical protein WC958_00020 [Dehalococcoidales bacterium]